MILDREVISLVANGAAIATSIIAGLAFFQFHWTRRSKRRRVEKLLREGLKRGQPWRTALGLSIELGISELEIIDASYRSGKIARLPINDPNGIAVGMMLACKSTESIQAAQAALSVACSPGGAAQFDFLPGRPMWWSRTRPQ